MNKIDENGVITRSKARLVAKGYSQAEVIVYEKNYSLVARLEVIRLLLEFAWCLDFKLYQIDVKYSFLNGYINEEVYVSQPLGFEDHDNPGYVFKLKISLYGLKQAPRAWYECLRGFLIKQGFNHGKVDTTLFIRRKAKNIILVQIYVDDIILNVSYRRAHTLIRI